MFHHKYSVYLVFLDSCHDRCLGGDALNRVEHVARALMGWVVPSRGLFRRLAEDHLPVVVVVATGVLFPEAVMNTVAGLGINLDFNSITVGDEIWPRLPFPGHLKGN